MRSHLFLFFILSLLLLQSCSSPEATTIWKEKPPLRNYNKIMIVGLVKDSLSLRKWMEDYFVKELNTLGYKTVSALEEFGVGGLSNMEKEATYKKLCNKGIDAVLIIALLNNGKEHTGVSPQVKYHTGLYYYNRIINYKSIQADPAKSKDQAGEKKKFFWEGILFDLQTLSPSYTVQTESFQASSTDSLAPKYGKVILSRLVKNKIVKPQVIVRIDSLQSF